MKKSISDYYILLLLALMFAMPGIAAYFFYHHPQWLGTAKVNKGTLLSEPLPLTSLDGKSKWRILLWSPEYCDEPCLQELDKLARVRLALGRKLYLVDQTLLLNDAADVSSAGQNMIQERDFHITTLTGREIVQLTALSNHPRIFIANPDNYVVLSYPSRINPEDVYKDLKLLLNTSETKNG
ncbi:MAG TPA: hypothetical protein PK657_03125 [Legionella sp.]|nr:hypothetical protein [Legionella sp.]